MNHPENEKFDIFIQAGQSNAEGYGHGPVIEEFVPDDDLLFYTAAGEIQPAGLHRGWDRDDMGDFSLTFLRDYKKAGLLAPGRKAIVLRAAVGGTGFSTGEWGMQDPLFLQMMEMIRATLALHPENTLKALLWHQGETDSDHDITPEEYTRALTRLVQAVRTEFHVPELPFLAGDFCPRWRHDHEAMCEPIRGALIDVCCGVGNARFVLTDTLAENDAEDTIHFSRQSLFDLGQRYFRSYRQIIGQ